MFSDCLPTQIALPISPAESWDLQPDGWPNRRCVECGGTPDGERAALVSPLCDGFPPVQWHPLRVYRQSSTATHEQWLPDHCGGSSPPGDQSTTVQKWYKMGLLQGKHTGGQKALWIVWTEEAEQRLGGQASFDSRMTSVKSLCKLHGKTWEQVIRWCMEEGHQIYRLRRGTTFRFYVLPASCSLQP